MPTKIELCFGDVVSVRWNDAIFRRTSEPLSQSSKTCKAITIGAVGRITQEELTLVISAWDNDEYEVCVIPRGCITEIVRFSNGGITLAEHTKTPITIKAQQWFKHGDHPAVRHFCRPDIKGESICPNCDAQFHEHGWIDLPERDQTVCPGDLINI